MMLFESGIELWRENKSEFNLLFVYCTSLLSQILALIWPILLILGTVYDDSNRKCNSNIYTVNVQREKIFMYFDADRNPWVVWRNYARGSHGHNDWETVITYVSN